VDHPVARHDDLEPSRLRHVAEVAFQTHAAIFVLVNLMLVGIWAAAGAGYFWPVWPILGWGLGVGIHGYVTYGRPPD
jgi:hypothetical protein